MPSRSKEWNAISRQVRDELIYCNDISLCVYLVPLVFHVEYANKMSFFRKRNSLFVIKAILITR
jgi:hypothetical protein